MCIHDTHPKRQLPALLNVPSLTPDKCIKACKDKGFHFAGVQFSKECWCGKEAPSKDRIVEMKECNMDCQGDSSIKCGAGMRMNVFQIEGILILHLLNISTIL